MVDSCWYMAMLESLRVFVWRDISCSCTSSLSMCASLSLMSFMGGGVLAVGYISLSLCSSSVRLLCGGEVAAEVVCGGSRGPDFSLCAAACAFMVSNSDWKVFMLPCTIIFPVLYMFIVVITVSGSSFSVSCNFHPLHIPFLSAEGWW